MTIKIYILTESQIQIVFIHLVFGQFLHVMLSASETYTCIIGVWYGNLRDSLKCRCLRKYLRSII